MKANLYKFLKQKEVSFIGAGSYYGQTQTGVEKFPSALREGGVQSVASALGWGFHDIGDLDIQNAISHVSGNAVPNVRNCEQVGLANELIHNTVKSEAQKGNFVLIGGGDHSIASATISGVKAVHRDLCVLWVNAHAASNTPATSPSANYHGMSAAHVLGWINMNLPGFDWLTKDNMLADTRIAFVGLRDVDKHERELLRHSGVSVFTMHEIDRWGIGEVMDMALHRINPHSDRPIHLTFNIDACDPSIAPATGILCRGGLEHREAHFVCERLAMTNSLVSMDMVEVNPDLDKQEGGWMHGDSDHITTDLQTVRLSLELISSALGKTVI